jgi:hypothetical protein
MSASVALLLFLGVEGPLLLPPQQEEEDEESVSRTGLPFFFLPLADLPAGRFFFAVFLDRLAAEEGVVFLFFWGSGVFPEAGEVGVGVNRREVEGDADLR